MGLGEMNYRALTSSASPNGRSAKTKSPRQAWKLIALTLVLAGGVWLSGTVTGLAKDKTPQTRTVSGVVLDEAGNLIQGATVELTDRQTGKGLDIYSQEGGTYQFADLRFDHDYTVKAMYKNSSSEVRQVSSLDTRARPVMNLTLQAPAK